MFSNTISLDPPVPEESTALITSQLPLRLSNKGWKPSELEIAVLEIHFQNNQHPNTEEKEAIIKEFDSQFTSQVKIHELDSWFKKERERILKKANKEIPKGTYRKFQRGELDALNTNFGQDNYPSLDNMADMAKDMDCSLSKIENWYKHTRRTLAKKGTMILKSKKYFKIDELKHLTDLFGENPCPPKTQITELSERLNCEKNQIKNWFSNRRKKSRIFGKKNNNFLDAQTASSAPEYANLSNLLASQNNRMSSQFSIMNNRASLSSDYQRAFFQQYPASYPLPSSQRVSPSPGTFNIQSSTRPTDYTSQHFNMNPSIRALNQPNAYSQMNVNSVPCPMPDIHYTQNSNLATYNTSNVSFPTWFTGDTNKYGNIPITPSVRVSSHMIASELLNRSMINKNMPLNFQAISKEAVQSFPQQNRKVFIANNPQSKNLPICYMMILNQNQY